MTTPDHDKEHEDNRLVRYRGKPNLDHTSGIGESFRFFFGTAGCLLLYFAALSIEEAYGWPATIRGLLKTVKMKFGIPGVFEFSMGHGPDSSAQDPTPKPCTDQIASQRERIEAALQEVADKVHAIQQKGGAVGFPTAPMQRQLEQAPYEFPDDPMLTEMARKVAHQQLKNTKQLPSPPRTALRIMKLAKDPDFDTKELVEVVKGDPAIAARLLQYVNSSMVGLGTPTTSIERAIVHLGRTKLRNIALGFSLVSGNRKGGCPEFNYDMFWAESTARAAAARHIAAYLKLGLDPDDAFVAGLLCQLGRLAFATALPDEYAKVLCSANPAASEQLAKLERRTFHIDHRELAGEMMAEWGMPEFFWRAILFQGDVRDEQTLPPNSPERALAMILSCTDTIWKVITAQGAPIGDDLQESVISQAEELGIARDVFPDRFDTMRDEWSTVGNLLSVTTLPVRPWADLIA